VNILFLLFLAYVLAPKIDLVSASGSGVRPEDFIAARAASASSPARASG
jgi:hypothetical protein